MKSVYSESDIESCSQQYIICQYLKPWLDTFRQFD